MFFKRKKRLKIVYITESTELYGGIKVAFRQAEALHRLGYNVKIMSNHPYPSWLEEKIPYIQADPFDKTIGENFDIIIAAGFRLPAVHHEQTKAKVFHLMQGYEGSFKEAKPFIKEINKTYELRMPTLTVSSQLKNIVENLFNNQHVYNIGQGLEHKYFYFSGKKNNISQDDTLNLFVFGHLHSDVKQVKTALEAFKIASKTCDRLRLVRITLFDCKEEEENIVGKKIDYHINITPRQVGDILRKKPGILLAPSSEGEGFGLPPLEAMACGIPVIMTKISSFTSFSPKRDYALFIDVGDASAMAYSIIELANNFYLRSKLIRSGFECAKNFSYDNVAKKIVRLL